MKTINSFFANGNVKSVLAIAAVAISSVFGFTSCDKNDDAFSQPTMSQQSTTNVQSEYKQAPVYSAVISDSYLDIYDIKVILHNGTQTKEVFLTKSNGDAKVEDHVGTKIPYHEYLFTEVNGQIGVSNPEVIVTPKADIQTILANMPAEGYETMDGVGFINGAFDANGKYIGEYIGSQICKQHGGYTPSGMMEKGIGVNYVYENMAALLAEKLMKIQ